ncbi:MAG: D-alanyl-D-alanine carboxypeptidase [Chloroflexi bacterium]|nr:D-alanyl-D-alanine carboxypeptidase [Chloroflexota bacterium]
MIGVPVVLVVIVVLMSRVLGSGGAAGDSAAVVNCPDGEACPAALSASQTPLPATPTPEPADVPADVPDIPSVLGRATAVIEQPCGVLLYEFNGTLTLPPASLTKIVTALVAAEWTDLSEIVTVEIDGPALSLETDSTVLGIEPGDELTMKDLVYGLLLRSGNDAALEIARYVAGDEDGFVDLMNDKVAELGLVDTQFTNPHGLDNPVLYSSAIDMARLGAELLRNAELAEVVATRQYQPAWDGPAIDNLNLLLSNYPGAIGVKTGFTDTADQTIVAAAERDGRTIVASVFGTTEMYVDARTLLDWAFAQEPVCDVAGSAASAR